MRISDSHTDFLTYFNTFAELNCFIKKAKRQGVRCVSCAVFTTQKELKVGDIQKFNCILKQLSTQHKMKLLLSIEDMGFVKNKAQLQKLIALKPFSATLTWNYNNLLAGGAHSNVGITKFGKQCIKQLEQNNILVDTAHMCKKTYWQFCKITQKPIYNSHSNIYAIKKHKRNLTDKQIQKIVETNGYMGITLYNNFMSKSAISSKEVALQFDYLIKKFGYKNFGLGTDFFGVDAENLPCDIKQYAQLKNVKKQLKKLGYNNKIINCLLYKNFKNFLRRTGYFKC